MGAAALALAGLVLSSPAVRDGGTIPPRYTCNGKGVSPPLRWTAPPPRSRSLTLLVTDPDAPGGTFVHWRATGLAPRAGAVQEGHHLRHEGLNGYGSRGWGPPCPPPGETHRYVFALEALDASGKPIAEARLTAHYRRR